MVTGEVLSADDRVFEARAPQDVLRVEPAREGGTNPQRIFHTPRAPHCAALQLGLANRLVKFGGQASQGAREADAADR